MQILFGCNSPAPALRFGNDDLQEEAVSPNWQQKLDFAMRVAYSEYQKNWDDLEIPVLIIVKDASAAVDRLKEMGLSFDPLLPEPPVLTGAIRLSQLKTVANLKEVDHIERSRETRLEPKFGCDSFQKS